MWSIAPGSLSHLALTLCEAEPRLRLLSWRKQGPCFFGTEVNGICSRFRVLRVDRGLVCSGFSGYELPSSAGSLDVYSITDDKWYTVQPAADPVHGYPGPRSVSGFTSFRSTSPTLQDTVAVLFHGERDASTLGHAGAGTFWDDVWLLTKNRELSATEGWAWKWVSVAAADGKTLPEGRGWFASAGWMDDKKTRIAMQGGLLSSNERSDELWELEIE